MDLGAFSISLAVKDLAKSRAFYEALGFSVTGGDADQGWLILVSGRSVIGLFQGMFEKNMLTFNPGWDGPHSESAAFDDVRVLAKRFEERGLTLTTKHLPDGGPAHIALEDPDGLDQHLARARPLDLDRFDAQLLSRLPGNCGARLHGLDPSGMWRRHKQGCCSLEDSNDARFVAAQLGARFYVLNFAEDFDRVIRYFVDEYKRGRTPNPCAVCNTDLKFGKLLDYARQVGADKVATGHYARIQHRDGRWRLLRGVDRGKDQSYYLFGLTQEQLAHAEFPLGGLTKAQVRTLAAEFELKTRDKPESMEICFVPEGDYRAVVAQHDPDALQPGPIVSTRGDRLGEHGGVAGFTIGQRRGLGVSARRPLYVVGIQPETNTVVVGEEDDLAIERITVADLNWIAIETLAPGQSLRSIVKVRYRHEGAPATLIGEQGGSVRVEFDQPVRSAAPGQCAVFYAEDSDEVLGGGWIM